MAKDRKTRPFVRWMLFLCPLVAALYFGLWPELDEMRDPPIPGEIVFKNERPSVTSWTLNGSGGSSSGIGIEGKSGSGWSMDWIHDRFDDVMAWDHNPWKSNPTIFGSHYMRLADSKNPKDQARALEIRRLADLLHQQVLERYPELAVELRTVPDERNGFLKWLDLVDRLAADPSRSGDRYDQNIELPESLRDHLSGKGSWDAAAMKSWLAKEQPLLDEVREIGLLPEQSINGIDLERYHFVSARLVKSASEALLLDARMRAGQGDVAGSLESVRAARGLADHFGQVETPTLLAATVEILVQHQIQDYTLSEIIPSMPEGHFDPHVWEQVVNPEVDPPNEYGRLMKGEWNVTSRWWIMPPLANPDEPKYPSDPDALIDHHATEFVRTIEAFDSESPADWSSVSGPVPMDTSYLSRDSRQLVEMMMTGAGAWSKGLKKSQSKAAMTQAAFAIMKGEAVPKDPVYGLPYGWDPATRVLSPPNDPAFEGVKAITVPAP